MSATHEVESLYAWWRLAAALALMTIGASGMYAMAVALPPVQAEFGVARGEASLPYTMTMIGFSMNKKPVGFGFVPKIHLILGSGNHKMNVKF